MIEQFKQAIEGAIQAGDFNNWVREKDREKAAKACEKICDEKMIEFVKFVSNEYQWWNGDRKWYDRDNMSYTTSQLLKLFKERK